MKTKFIVTLAAILATLSVVATILLSVLAEKTTTQQTTKATGYKAHSALLTTPLVSTAFPSGTFELSKVEPPVAAIYLGFTHCPDICPTGLAKLGSALRQLPASTLDNTLPVFISVDPERDTPKYLTEYTTYFHPNIVGATASPENLEVMANILGAYFRIIKETPDQTDYTVEHSASLYVVDLTTSSVVSLPHSSTPQDISDAITKAHGTP